MSAHIASGKPAKKERIAYLDLLRILACVFVIINHTNSQIFTASKPSVTWFASLAYLCFVKPAIPVFLMISGYTLLDRMESYQKTLSRCLRMVCTLVFFSVVYYLHFYLTGYISHISIGDFISRFFSNSILSSFWYLYFYIGAMLILPFLQRMVCVMERKDFHVLFLICGFFLCLWPMVVHYVPSLQITKDFSLSFFSVWICYMLMGCYLKRYCPPSKKWFFVCLAVYVGTSILNILLTWLEYYRCGGTDYLFFDNSTLLHIVSGSFCFFYVISTVKLGQRAQRVCLALSKLTFGIHLISDLVMEPLQVLYIGLLGLSLNPLAAMVVYEIAVFGVSAGVVWVLKKVPVIRDLM